MFKVFQIDLLIVFFSQNTIQWFRICPTIDQDLLKQDEIWKVRLRTETLNKNWIYCFTSHRLFAISETWLYSVQYEAKNRNSTNNIYILDSIRAQIYLFLAFSSLNSALHEEYGRFFFLRASNIMYNRDVIDHVSNIIPLILDINFRIHRYHFRWSFPQKYFSG